MRHDDSQRLGKVKLMRDILIVIEGT